MPPGFLVLLLLGYWYLNRQTDRQIACRQIIRYIDRWIEKCSKVKWTSCWTKNLTRSTIRKFCWIVWFIWSPTLRCWRDVQATLSFALCTKKYFIENLSIKWTFRPILQLKINNQKNTWNLLGLARNACHMGSATLSLSILFCNSFGLSFKSLIEKAIILETEKHSYRWNKTIK